MLKLIYLSLFGLIPACLSHGTHDNTGPNQGETIQEYAQRHVRLVICSYTTSSWIHSPSKLDVVRTSYVGFNVHPDGINTDGTVQRLVWCSEFLPIARFEQVGWSRHIQKDRASYISLGTDFGTRKKLKQSTVSITFIRRRSRRQTIPFNIAWLVAEYLF